MTLKKTFLVAATLIGLFAIVVIIQYGIDTNCPNLADNVYVYCRK